MKYDDDELAEAALLLAHHDGTLKMPAALEKKILAQGKAIASELRFTTTKAAAVSFEEALDVPSPAQRRSIARTWAGWFAAAACFAVVVYAWRSRALEQSIKVSATSGERSADVTASREIALTERSGKRAGSVRWDSLAESWQLSIDELASTGADEHYRVWVSASDAAHAVPIGALACATECRNRVLALGGSLPHDGVKKVWLTRNALVDVTTVLAEGRVVVVGEGMAEVP